MINNTVGPESNADIADILALTQALAKTAGAEILAARGESLSSDFKNGEELVTNADLQADEIITNAIKKQYPDHDIISEESAPQPDLQRLQKHPTWIIDPIDGTVNYAHGHQQSAVSIAFVRDGEIQSGVVYNPFNDELFSAVRGQGAWLNGAEIEVSQEQTLRRAIIATGFPYGKDEIPELVDRLAIVLTHAADIRRLGSAALDLCWVAMGRLDGYYESLSLWDFAAGQLIAIEAGAVYGHFKPVPEGVPEQFHHRHILVANPSLFLQLHTLLEST